YACSAYKLLGDGSVGKGEYFNWFVRDLRGEKLISSILLHRLSEVKEKFDKRHVILINSVVEERVWHELVGWGIRRTKPAVSPFHHFQRGRLVPRYFIVLSGKIVNGCGSFNDFCLDLERCTPPSTSSMLRVRIRIIPTVGVFIIDGVSYQ